jgi:hypothetical protein
MCGKGVLADPILQLSTIAGTRPALIPLGRSVRYTHGGRRGSCWHFVNEEIR